MQGRWWRDLAGLVGPDSMSATAVHYAAARKL